MARAITIIGASAVLAAAAPVDDPDFAAIRAGDLRLAAIGDRLATANVALCDMRAASFGWQLHTLRQYPPGERAAARRAFGFATGLAVEGVIAGGAAAAAGVRANDALVAADGLALDIALPARSVPADTRQLVAADRALSAAAGRAVTMTLIREGRRLAVDVTPRAACRTRFELDLSSGFDAEADGEVVRIKAGFLDSYADDETAVIVAHELAHNILRHRARLDAAGVDRGLLGDFGPSVKFYRQTELQADVLGVYLLANAGYDPVGAARFWSRFGPAHAGGMLRARTHPGWRDRVAVMTRVAGEIAGRRERPIVPAILAWREQPLDGNWQALQAGR